jgi:hypothetical protein
LGNEDMSKKYEIRTIEDILKVISEKNINNFIRDFENFLGIYLKSQKHFNGKMKLIKYIWEDDGKNNNKMKIFIKL